MKKMKIYKKPEIKIEKFDVADVITDSIVIGEPDLDLNSDEIFYGADAGDQGYLVAPEL